MLQFLAHICQLQDNNIQTNAKYALHVPFKDVVYPNRKTYT